MSYNPLTRRAKDTVARANAPVGKLGEVIADMIEKDGKGLDRVRAVLAIRMNQYNNIELDEEELKGVAKSFLNIEVGTSTSLVMICSKKKCLYKTRCQLFISNKCPEGKECIHENKIMTSALDQYLKTLDIKLDNYPEMVMVNQLVEYELLEHRCNSILSSEHTDLKMRSVIGIDSQGMPITKEDISHAIQIKNQMFKNKMQLLDSFTATRKEELRKAIALKEIRVGHSKLISDMRDRLKDIKTIQEDDPDFSPLDDENIEE